MLHHGTLVVLKRLSNIYGDESVSQETLPTVLKVVGHIWPLLPKMAILSCSTYVTRVWLQQQPENSVVFIHKLSEIGWDKTFNLFLRTNHTLVKFSPDVIKRQGGIDIAVTCTSDMVILFSDACACWLNLSPADGRKRVYRCRGECFDDACVIERFLVWDGINRGYLVFLVKDRNLFHWVDTIGNIFTSGAATSENITDGVHKMK